MGWLCLTAGEALVVELRGTRRQGGLGAKRMMTVDASRPACSAGGGPLERSVRQDHPPLRLRYAYVPPQPCGLYKRSVDAGYLASLDSGRLGRRSNSPPQFGQMPKSLPCEQFRQKVHSNEQMTAFSASAGRSESQHSQDGRICNTKTFLVFGSCCQSSDGPLAPGRSVRRIRRAAARLWTHARARASWMCSVSA
jgi:hypothetical protein